MSLSGTEWGGVARVSGVASAEECGFLADWLRAAIAAGQGRQGEGNPIFNGRAICYPDLSDEAVSALVDRLRRHVALIGQAVYGWPVLYPSFSDLVQWREGPGLGWHVDSAFFPARAVTAVICLDAGWQGGETEVRPPAAPAYSAQGAIGEAVMFRSSWEHRVAPITAGVRHTLACWSTCDRHHVEYR